MQVVIEDVVLERTIQRIVNADMQSSGGIFTREVQNVLAELVKSKELSVLIREKIMSLIPEILERLVAETMDEAIKAKINQTLRRMMESGEMAAMIRKTLEQANG